MVGGRSLPQWIAVLTMTATWVDGGYLLGTAEGAFKTNVASGVQGGLCFGFSLVFAGIFFSRRMRRLGYNTLIDPFESRFGKHWAAVLFVPTCSAQGSGEASSRVPSAPGSHPPGGGRPPTHIPPAADAMPLLPYMGSLADVA